MSLQEVGTCLAMSQQINILKQAVDGIFPIDSYPFLREQALNWDRHQPLKGLKILHNIPVTLETIAKLVPLLCSGAEITVTHLQLPELRPNAAAVAILQEAGINYIPSHADIVGEFDIGLDCGAQIPKMPRVRITRGLAELTQFGTMIYKSTAHAVPVISADDSFVKNLECMYGTGEAFIRALKEQIGDVFYEKSFLIFGYGKVGKGIVKYLKKYTKAITLVEADNIQVEKAKSAGLQTIHINEISKIRSAANHAFCIVAVTGKNNIIDQVLSVEDCNTAVLASMGVPGEFGSKFPMERVLCNKVPINFSLKHPTLMHYIDPVFYAHNLIAELLITGDYTPNYHPFPRTIDVELCQKWVSIHQEQIDEIW